MNQLDMQGRHAVVTGGANEQRQLHAIKNLKAQVVIATPGRLQDFLQRKLVKLNSTRFLVLDEAHLDVQAQVLVEVAAGGVFLGAVDGRDLEHALEADHRGHQIDAGVGEPCERSNKGLAN